jgi:hypothetical protein
MNDHETREVIASVNVSLDSFSAGPDGHTDVMWFVEPATPGDGRSGCSTRVRRRRHVTC